MNQYFAQIYQLLQTNQDCSTILQEVEKEQLSPKDMKSFISLKLRFLIKNNMMKQIEELLSTKKLMKRDYWLCIEYYYYNNRHKSVDIMTQYIDCIDTNDIDIMISNKWYDLIERWDGSPVVSNYISNTCNTSMLIKYNFDVSDMVDIYRNKIPPSYCKPFEEKIKKYDILIDGANISHIGKNFNYDELIKVIDLIEEKGLKPGIILHCRHIIKSSRLNKYIVRTPKNNYDDNFLLYGMFRYNKMIISNDMFRDHIVDVSSIVKCYIDMMTITYLGGKLQFPQYSKCIQVIDNSIYVPCNNGIYLIKNNTD